MMHKDVEKSSKWLWES